MPDKAREIIEELHKREGRIIDLTKGAARHGFDRARKKTELETLRFHDLRHIYSHKQNVELRNECSGDKCMQWPQRYKNAYAL